MVDNDCGLMLKFKISILLLKHLIWDNNKIDNCLSIIQSIYVYWKLIILLTLCKLVVNFVKYLSVYTVRSKGLKF